MQFSAVYDTQMGDYNTLTHWGRVTHICASNLTIIGSDNGLQPGQRHAIIWTNAGILLIGPLGTNFSEILIEINTFPFKNIHLKMSSGKWWSFCLGLNVLTYWGLDKWSILKTKVSDVISQGLIEYIYWSLSCFSIINLRLGTEVDWPQYKALMSQYRIEASPMLIALDQLQTYPDSWLHYIEDTDYWPNTFICYTWK